MIIVNLTLAHFAHFIPKGSSSFFTNLRAYKAPSTNVEDSLQISLFMQNKPNVKVAQINVNSYMKSKYEKLDTWLNQKNKPNSNPIKACPERSRMGQSPKTPNERKLISYRGLHKKR